MKLYLLKFSVIISILLLSLVMWSCDIKSNYQILTTVFDGVPNPDSTNQVSIDSLRIAKNIDPKQKKQNQTPMLYAHKPYTERECAKCHSGSGSNKLVKDITELCFDCHKNIANDSLFVHGPVIEGYCFKCHEPHTSKFKKLKVKDNQSLCYECHVKVDILKNDAHKSIKDTVCWECHNPHSSSKEYYLRASK